MTRERWIIDCHAHVGQFRGYDLSLRTLLDELERGEIALALISNIDGATVPGKTRGHDEPEVNRATKAVVERHPDRFRGLLWGRPGSGSVEALRPFLSDRVKAPGEGDVRWTRRTFVGLKLHPEMNQFPADAEFVDPYLELADEAGLVVVFHCDAQVEQASADRIVAIARRHPQVPVVLYHTGFGGPHEPAIEAAAAALESDGADVYLETAQLPPAAALRAVERVGARRVLFGTDATYYGPGHYERYHELLTALHAALAPEDLHRVLAGNTARIFRLSPDESERNV